MQRRTTRTAGISIGRWGKPICSTMIGATALSQRTLAAGTMNALAQTDGGIRKPNLQKWRTKKRVAWGGFGEG